MFVGLGCTCGCIINSLPTGPTACRCIYIGAEKQETPPEMERFFALMTGRMIRRGTFHGAGELEHALYQWLAHWNQAPKPFVWKASATSF